MSFFYQIFPGTIVQNALFPSRLTLSMKWFFRKNVHFGCFFGFLVGKLRQGCQNNSLRWQKNNWGKWLYTSKELILDIVISHSTELFVFWLKTWAKVFALFLPKVAWTNIKNGLFSCRLTHSIIWFSQENFLSRCFNWILRGKAQAELSKKAYNDRKTNDESGFLLRMVWFLILLCHIEQISSDFGWKF